MDEKKVNRSLHGVSLGTITAAVFLLLSHPGELASLSWYISETKTIQQNVNVVPQIQSAVTEIKIRMDRMDRVHAHEKDSLIDLIHSLQRGVSVLAAGKVPFDSVKVRSRVFHKDTSWLWRVRE